LFGRATFSGAINYITRKPTNEQTGEVFLKAGQDERLEATAWTSGPLIEDTLLYFVSAGIQQYGGEWRNNLLAGDVNTTNDPLESQFAFAGPFTWSPNVPAAGQPDCPPGYATLPGNSRTGCPSQLVDNTKLGGEETVDFSGKLLWNVADWGEITARLDYIETDDDHFPALFLPVSSLNCFRPPDPGAGFAGDPGGGVASPGWFCGKLGPHNTVPTKVNLPHFRTGVTTFPPSGGPITSDPAPFIGTRIETTRALLQGVFELGAWELTARLGVTDEQDQFVRDLDRSYGLGPSATGLFEQYSITDTEDQSFEVRLASPSDQQLSGFIGYYYYELEETGIIRDFNGFGIRNIDGINTADFRRYTDTRVVNNAVFGSINYELNEQWTFSIDARYAKDTPEANTNPPIAISDIDQFPFTPLNAKQNFYSFTPRFIARYEPNDDLNFYLQAAKGNKPGGYNTFQFFDSDTAEIDTLASLGATDCSLPGQAAICSKGIIEEEEAWTYEIGAKTSLLDNRLTLNTALYYIDWTNQQVNTRVDIPTNCDDALDPDRNCTLQPNNIVENVGQSKVWGAEVEATWLATDSLTLTLGYGLADSELEDFADPVLAVLKCPLECWETTIPGVLSPLTDDALALRAELGNVDGNESPRSPKHQLNIGGAYRRSLTAAMDWFLRSDITWESRQWATVANLTHTGEPLIWNAWSGIEADNWTLSFYVDNILDDDTSVLNNDFPLFDLSQATGISSGVALTQPPPFNSIFTTVYPTGYLVTPRPGRNAGLTFQYRFGAI
jgi:outer membrane receptor protein involved in Fe transport